MKHESQRIGSMIRFHRKMAKLSQSELGKLSGVGKTSVFDVEHGKSTVRLSTLMKLLHTLNIRINFSGPLMNLFEKEQHEVPSGLSKKMIRKENEKS